MTLDLSADGRLTVSPFVTEAKFNHMAEMLQGVRQRGYAGDRAGVDLRETLSTSDAPFSYIHLANFKNLELYDKSENIWRDIATEDEADDFRPTTFYNYAVNYDQLKMNKGNIIGGTSYAVAPTVAELDTYPYAFGYIEEDAHIALEKRGYKTGFSLEMMVNDIHRLAGRFPGDMLAVAEDTDEFVVMRALVEGVTSTSQMVAGTDFITGDAIPANAPASAAAIRTLLRQIGTRVDNRGNAIGLATRYNVVVGIGQADALQWDIDNAQNIVQIADTGTTNDIVYGRPRNTGLGRINKVVESKFVSGDAWYLVPVPGTSTRPTVVKMNLRGYTMPEVYVSNFNGTPVAGGASGNPFQAFSFDNDSVDFKLRTFTNAGLISEDQIGWSDGSGS